MFPPPIIFPNCDYLTRALEQERKNKKQKLNNSNNENDLIEQVMFRGKEFETDEGEMIQFELTDKMKELVEKANKRQNL